MFILGNSKKNCLSQKESNNKYYDDEYSIDLNNNNDSHSIIVKNVINYKKILDVGCGVGYIGKKIKEIKKVSVDGIEIDKEAVKCAKKYYDKVYNFSLEDDKSAMFKSFFANDKKYDCIIMADIIEHCTSPGKLIMLLSRKLTKDGTIIVSTPNISNVDIIRGLINNDFNYNVTGILDTTHNKFFTMNSFNDFIENVNEKYGLNYGVSIIGRTYAKDNSINNDFLEDVIGKDIYVYQNIFKISSTIKTKKNKHIDYYKKINTKYVDLKNNFKKEIDLINKQKEKIKIQEQIIHEKNDEINKILSSKSWKITKPLRIVSKLIRRKK